MLSPMTADAYQPTRVTLLERLRGSGDDEAWREFEQLYRGFIFSLILRMGLSAQDAEDISQAVLTKVWRKIDDFEYNRNRGRFHNWLAAMTRNTVRDFFRSRRNFITGRDAVDLDEHYHEIETRVLPDIERLAREEWVLHVTNLAWERVREELSETKRKLFKMVSDEVPTREIARRLGIAEASVRVYKAEIFEKMRREIRRINEEMD